MLRLKCLPFHSTIPFHKLKLKLKLKQLEKELNLNSLKLIELVEYLPLGVYMLIPNTIIRSPDINKI